MEKIVFSATLRGPLGLEHSRLAGSDLAATVAGLRRRPGGDIAVTGGSALARAAARQGLVDEYQLIVHPVALGAGRPLFDAAARPRLRDRRDYDNGVLRPTYVPADAG
nr:hypothetical protein GCM10020063_029850 [Dactylosporangium thailandense]